MSVVDTNGIHKINGINNNWNDHMAEFRQSSGVFDKAFLFLRLRIGLLMFLFICISPPLQQDFYHIPNYIKTMLNAPAAGKGSLPNIFQQRQEHGTGSLSVVTDNLSKFFQI